MTQCFQNIDLLMIISDCSVICSISYNLNDYSARHCRTDDLYLCVLQTFTAGVRKSMTDSDGWGWNKILNVMPRGEKPTERTTGNTDREGCWKRNGWNMARIGRDAALCNVKPENCFIFWLSVTNSAYRQRKLRGRRKKGECGNTFFFFFHKLSKETACKSLVTL